MKKLLLVVDVQNDFIIGALGSPQSEKVLPNIKVKIERYRKSGDSIIFTRDTHHDGYLETQEGKFLPVKHCIKGSYGHMIADGLQIDGDTVFDKPAFGSLELAKQVDAEGFDGIEICGLYTDICVVSNALILKTQLPETEIIVDASCCAGVTQESHEAALLTMKMCQIKITGAKDAHD